MKPKEKILTEAKRKDSHQSQKELLQGPHYCGGKYGT